MITERQQKLVDVLRDNMEFREMMASFAERMSVHLSWDISDDKNSLQSRLNSAASEVNQFMRLFV